MKNGLINSNVISVAPLLDSYVTQIRLSGKSVFAVAEYIAVSIVDHDFIEI